MGKLLKVTNKSSNDSILRQTITTAQKRIKKKAKGKVNKLKVSKSPEKAQNQLARKQQRNAERIAKRKLRKENFHKELGVLYLSHIPHGFYEEQLERFFTQFGKIEKVLLRRSTVSGRSKGHAFIVFRYKEVAHIAAETTNNYLMGKRILKAKVIPYDEVNPKWFYIPTPSNINATAASKRRRKYIKSVNRKLTPEEGMKRLDTQKNTLEKMVRNLNEKGIDYKLNLV